MLLDELLERVKDPKVVIDFETVKIPNLPNAYSRLLPDFNNAFTISKARYVNKCLKISVDEENYYFIEAYVLFRKGVTVKEKTEKKRFLLFLKRKVKKFVSNEEEVISEFEKAKNYTQAYNIDYRKYYDDNINSVLYFFALRTYFIYKETGELQEVHIQDLRKIKHTYCENSLDQKKALLQRKLNGLGKTIF